MASWGSGLSTRQRFWIRTGALGAVGIVFVGLAAGPAGDGVLHLIKDADVQLISWALLTEEIAQAVFVVMLVGEFEDGALCLIGLPADCTTGFTWSPGNGADEPGQFDAGELAGGTRVDVKMGVRMSLEEGCGDGFRHRAFDRFGDHVGFVVAPGHEDEFFATKNASDTHGDGEVRHIFFTSEIRSGILTGDAVQGDTAGQRVTAGAGFIEADVACAPDAENLEVDAAEESIFSS